jgi:hypothetical protein
MFTTTEEYRNLIRTLLATNCVVEYKKTIYEQDDHAIEEYRGVLIDSIKNPDTWVSIFNKPNIHCYFEYYLLLQEDLQIEPTTCVPVFTIPTFQDYIDNLVRLETLGPADYQNFIKSMQEPTFRANMEQKYNKHIFQNQMKNHIIYIVQLYLLQTTGFASFFTEKEHSYLDLSINLIPFFEYIGASNYTIDDLESLHVNVSDYSDIEKTIQTYKEIAALQLIKKTLLQ